MRCNASCLAALKTAAHLTFLSLCRNAPLCYTCQPTHSTLPKSPFHLFISSIRSTPLPTTSNKMSSGSPLSSSPLSSLPSSGSDAPSPPPSTPSRVVTLQYDPNKRPILQPAAAAATAATNNHTNGVSSPAAAATPARTSTPTPRAPSAVPTPAAATMPAEAAENGAPTRVYLNTKVTSHVLDGMKMLVKEK